MAVGVEHPENPAPVAGVRLGSTEAGVRKPGRPDLVVMELAGGTTTAAVFTRNRFRAAPVRVAEAHLAHGAPRYLLINTGNANAGTGARGLRDARRSCAALAECVGCEPEAILPFSTGVIGEPLAVERLEAGLAGALAALQSDHWLAAADAIRTTDTRPKVASRQVALAGGTVTVTGMAKGAGMIRPDMATMLAFVATDALVDREHLHGLLREAVEGSFNRITVDGDTSTNDACVLSATGASGVAVPAQGEDAERFRGALQEVCRELAQAIVRDGEGATRFITIRVTGTSSEEEGAAVGFTIAHSPLVKTAFFAGDPNWGRILAAVGRAGVTDLDVERVRIWLDDYLIAEQGGRATDYQEAEAAARMAQEAVTVHVDLDRGHAESTVWTCDFSYEYVRINAEYRT